MGFNMVSYALILTGFLGAVSVKDAPFNAVGDGVADDTAAIQAAANFCNSKLQLSLPSSGQYQGTSPELLFPNGKYKLSGSITIGSYQSIRGEDAIIVQTASVPVLVYNNCYQNRITGMQ